MLLATVPGMNGEPSDTVRSLEIRLAERRDAEGIRAIYNHYVAESTALFDLVPRTLDEQVQWIDEHSGGHPAVVADARRRDRGVRVALALPVTTRLLHHRRGLGVPARRAPRAAGSAGGCSTELVPPGRGPRLPRGDRPDHRRQRGLDPRSTPPAASSSWAPSERWAASSAGGSTSSRCSGCCRTRNRPLPASGATAGRKVGTRRRTGGVGRVGFEPT